MQYRLFILVLILGPWFLIPCVQAQEASKKQIFNGYSGGMMLHAGYMFGEIGHLPYNPQGMTYGIGGALRINLWEHLRIGGEGYVSTMPTGLTDLRNTLQTGSYIRNGWGGLLVDAYWRCERFWPYIGGTIGGGAKRSLFIREGSLNDWEAEPVSMFNKQSYFMIDPFVGFDYLLTTRIHLTFKLDYVLALHEGHLLRPTGPRFYFGFLFCH